MILRSKPLRRISPFLQLLHLCQRKISFKQIQMTSLQRRYRSFFQAMTAMKKIRQQQLLSNRQQPRVLKPHKINQCRLLQHQLKASLLILNQMIKTSKTLSALSQRRGIHQLGQEFVEVQLLPRKMKNLKLLSNRSNSTSLMSRKVKQPVATLITKLQRSSTM